VNQPREKLQLVASNEQLLRVIHPWFTNLEEIYTWGGPAMRYPMPIEAFVQTLQAPHLRSYALVDQDANLLAFGQHYVRLGRHHLGRLVVNPQERGRGLGKILVTNLLAKAGLDRSATGASLFVFASNVVAYRCYQALGFAEAIYPEAMPANMDNCLYMVRD
jgi:ribosomal protein S18 acetylase RimI-like enzyme